jgi:hypothetical protein
VKIQAYLAYGIPRNNLKRMTLLQRVRWMWRCFQDVCANFFLVLVIFFECCKGPFHLISKLCLRLKKMLDAYIYRLHIKSVGNP